MRRRLFNCVSVLSLFLCATTLVSWAASTYREETLGWAGWKDKSAGIWRGWGIKTEGGRVVGYWFSGTWKFDDPGQVGASDASMQPHFVHESHAIVGYSYPRRNAFEWRTYHTSASGTYIDFRFIGFALWLPAALFAIPVVLWAVPLLLRRRRVSRQGFDVLPQSA